MLPWSNPVFRMELRRYGRPRHWIKYLIVIFVAGVLGYVYVYYSPLMFSQLLLSDGLLGSNLSRPWGLRIWQIVRDVLNSWRWISIFVVYFLMRSPSRIFEIEDLWLTRLKPRDILFGKLLSSYVFFFVLFNCSFLLALLLPALHAYLPLGFPPTRIAPADEIFWLYFTNPGYFIYMLIAPAYATFILSAVMLRVYRRERAFLLAFLVYLVICPYLQEIITRWIEGQYGIWLYANRELFVWLPDDKPGIQGMFIARMRMYLSRAAALLFILTPFAIYLRMRFSAIMMRHFELRHF